MLWKFGDSTRDAKCLIRKETNLFFHRGGSKQNRRKLFQSSPYRRGNTFLRIRVPRNIANRIARLEAISGGTDDGFTLEKLCRAMWQMDKTNFLKVAKHSSLNLFVRQFELEDAKPDRLVRRRPHPPEWKE
jgi:hypothetical protein